VSKQVNIYEAKSQLSRLVDEVEAGAEIVIARNGRPVARLVPLQRVPHERKPGAWRGKGWIAPDFDETPEEIIDLWYGKESAG
jgi:prevent-host-death family protein